MVVEEIRSFSKEEVNGAGIDQKFIERRLYRFLCGHFYISTDWDPEKQIESKLTSISFESRLLHSSKFNGNSALKMCFLEVK